MSHRCAECGAECTFRTKLSNWELAELRNKARSVMAEHPPRHYRGERHRRLAVLADDYGINLRTLYRYMKQDRMEKAA